MDRTEWIEKMTSYVDDISSAELDSLWNEFDTDESKYLNQDQFVEMIVEVMKRYGLDIQIKLVWAHFDRDEDGLLQADEFNNFIHRFGLGEEEEEIVVSMRLIQNLTLESDILKREIFSTYTPAGEPVSKLKVLY